VPLPISPAGTTGTAAGAGAEEEEEDEAAAAARDWRGGIVYERKGGFKRRKETNGKNEKNGKKNGKKSGKESGKNDGTERTRTR